MSTGLIATIIFALTYIGIIFTKLPKLNIDRPTAAFVGAVAMLCFGVVSFQEAVSFIDFNTIFLLLGMMLMISVLKADGFLMQLRPKFCSLPQAVSNFLSIRSSLPALHLLSWSMTQSS